MQERNFITCLSIQIKKRTCFFEMAGSLLIFFQFTVHFGQVGMGCYKPLGHVFVDASALQFLEVITEEFTGFSEPVTLEFQHAQAASAGGLDIIGSVPESIQGPLIVVFRLFKNPLDLPNSSRIVQENRLLRSHLGGDLIQQQPQCLKAPLPEENPAQAFQEFNRFLGMTGAQIVVHGFDRMFFFQKHGEAKMAFDGFGTGFSAVAFFQEEVPKKPVVSEGPCGAVKGDDGDVGLKDTVKK